MELKIAPEELSAAVAHGVSDSLRGAGILDKIDEAIATALALRGLLNKEQAAKFLQIELRTLEIWMRAAGDRGGRGVPHLKIGDAVRFKLQSLETWVAQYEVNKVLANAA